MPYSPQDILAGRQYVAQQENSDQLYKVASASMTYGDELAIRKIAAMENEAKEEKEEEEKEERGEHPKLNEEEKKEASAMGMFAFEGYINKLAEAGDLIYGDASVYIRKLAEQRRAYEKVATIGQYADDIARSLAHPSRLLGASKGGRDAGRITAGGIYGMGGGAALGAGVGALASDDPLSGAGYGALAGGLGGGALGAGMTAAAPYARRAYNKMIRPSAAEERMAAYRTTPAQESKERLRQVHGIRKELAERRAGRLHTADGSLT